MPKTFDFFPYKWKKHLSYRQIAVTTFEMTDFNEEYINTISSLLTKELIAVLEDYSVRKISRCNFLGGGNLTTKGLTSGDYVNEAIVSVFMGKRLWDQKVDFILFMKGAIRSMISHSYELKEANITQRESSISYFKGDKDEDYTLDSHPNHSANPLQHTINSECERMMWAIMEDLEDDPILSGIFQHIYDGISKPSEIAKALETTTKEINNGKKRLASRLKQYRENQLIGGAI